MPGLPVAEALRQIVGGIEDVGCTARIVRLRSTFDLGVIGLTAAQLAGSGIGVGLQAEGTAVINRRDLPPLACLGLYSIAPLLTAEMYRALGVNAGHAEVVALVSVEREACVPDAPPVDVEVRG